MAASITIRLILPADNSTLASIVRTVMSEFNADPLTTIIGDPTLNAMYENYQEPRAIYHIVELNNQIVGGCGIKKLQGSDDSICELQRMFLLKEARGLGIGKKLLETCLIDARNFQYKKMYLETLSQMHTAISLYRKFGFKTTPNALGKTGHSGCDLRMLLELS